MEQLKSQLDQLIQKLPDASAVRNRLAELYSFYPFNEFEYIISTLLGRDILTLDQYYEIRDSYMERNSFLYLFEISAPSHFWRGVGTRASQRAGSRVIQTIEET